MSIFCNKAPRLGVGISAWGGIPAFDSRAPLCRRQGIVVKKATVLMERPASP